MTSLFWLGMGNLAIALPLALAAWLCGRFVRRPALTHGLWVLVLLKLVTPPLGVVPICVVDGAAFRPTNDETAITVAAVRDSAPPLAFEFAAEELNLLPWDAGPPVEFADDPQVSVPPNAAVAPVESAPIPRAPLPGPTFLDRLSSTIPWIVDLTCLIWIFGAVAAWYRLSRNAWQFQRLLDSARLAPAPVRERVEALAAAMGVECPRVVFAPGEVSPLLWVWGRSATLVLPGSFFERLDDDKQSTLLVHELAHWRRGDHWVRRLECLAGGLYWWCPLVWWAQSEMHQAEEELCDAWVVATLPDSARTYALALVETVDFLAGARPMLPPLASGLGPFPSLQRRLTMIFRSSVPRRLTLAGLLGLVGLGALLLTWSPAPMSAHAQDEERPRPPKKKEPPPRDDGERGEPKGRPEPKRGGPEGPPEDVQKLREELKLRHAELEQLQRELQRKARELQGLVEKMREAEGGRPDFKKPPVRPQDPRGEGPKDGRGPKGPPEDGKGPPPRPEGGPRDQGGDVGRRLDDLERKLEMMLRELGGLRRDLGGQGGPPRGPGGPPPGGGRPRPDADGPPPPPPEGKEKSRFGVEFDFKFQFPPRRKDGPDGPPPPRSESREDERFETAPVPPRRVADPTR